MEVHLDHHAQDEDEESNKANRDTTPAPEASKPAHGEHDGASLDHQVPGVDLDLLAEPQQAEVEHEDQAGGQVSKPASVAPEEECAQDGVTPGEGVLIPAPIEQEGAALEQLVRADQDLQAERKQGGPAAAAGATVDQQSGAQGGLQPKPAPAVPQ